MNIIEFITSKIDKGTPLIEVELKRILANIYFAYKHNELSEHNYKVLVQNVYSHTNVSIDDFLKILHNVLSMKNNYSMYYIITQGAGEAVAIDMDKAIQNYDDISYIVDHNTYGRLFFKTYDDAEQFRRKLTPNDFSKNNLNTNTLYVYPYYFNYTQPNLVEFNLKQGKVFVLG